MLSQGSHPIHDEHLQQTHPEQTTDIKRVVCIALDASGFSEYAFHWTLENYVRPESDLVVLLNVRPVASIPGPFGTTYMDFTDYLGQIEEQNRTESHALLQYYATLVKQWNEKTAVKAIALRGDPRDEITRKIKEVNADVLIIGSRGLSMLKRTFLGSVSDYCVHNADCPVIVIRHPNPDSVQQYSTHVKEAMELKMKQAKMTQKPQPVVGTTLAT